jgi:hypothetical protein
MILGEFLKARLGDAGAWNCSTDEADWCMTKGYPDFAAPWRDIVDPDECERVVIEAGGLAVLWDRGIGDALPDASAPYQPGDIGVVTAHGLEAGAIFTGERWAIRRQRGHLYAHPSLVAVVAAWRP